MRRWEHPQYSAAPKCYQGLSSSVGALLGVFPSYDSGKGKDRNAVILLAGQKRDIEMAIYLSEAIKNQIGQLLEQYKEQCGEEYTRSRGNAYKIGVSRRVHEWLQELIDEVSDGRAEKGLILASAAKEKRRRGHKRCARHARRIRRRR